MSPSSVAGSTPPPAHEHVCVRCGAPASAEIWTFRDGARIRLVLCEQCWKREREILGKTGVMVEGPVHPIADWAEAAFMLAALPRSPRTRELGLNLALMAAAIRHRSAHLMAPAPPAVASFLEDFDLDEG